MKRFVVVLYTATIGPLLFAADTPAVLVKQVDPNAGRSKAGVIFEAADVEMVVDETGMPFSLESTISLPEYVVKALEQWQYSPYKKNGRSVPFAAKLTVPVARPLTPAVERSLVPRWQPAKTEISEAVRRGRELNAATVQALEANLPEAEALGNPRTSALVYYANQATQAPEQARAARGKLLTWLVQHYPQDDVLGSPFALVNRDGETLADAGTSSQLTKLWRDAVAQYPTDETVREHALNFWQVASPRTALEMLARLPRWRGTASWAGDVYGLAALGVTALSPATGKAVAVASSPDPILCEAARRQLLKSEDLKMVLAGLVTVTAAGRSLAVNHQLPDSYGAFCQSLLARAKAMYPQTSQSCDTSMPSPGSDDRMTAVAYDEKVTEAKLLKRVPPVYPSEAKAKWVQGTITFSAIISKSGDIEELGLKGGPFLLYPASLEAVRQWRFRPTSIDNKPVDVSTVITVNFALSR